MNKTALILASFFALNAASVFAAEKDHVGHGMNYANFTPGHSTHQAVIDGVKATFNIQTMEDAMKTMRMEMPKGVNDTHHISVSFNDMNTGTAITEGEVMVKTVAGDKSEQTKEMTALHGHFGADFNLAKKGKYGVMCKFRLGDGKTRSTKFWYEVK